MALKLQVPWADKPLEVGQFEQLNHIIAQMDGGHPHVETTDGDLVVVDFFGESNEVPDVSRYRILEDSHCGCVRHSSRYRIADGLYVVPHCDVSGQELEEELRQAQALNIVLLLESPHRDEYQSGDVNCPIAPANGETGDNIDRCLATVLSCIKEDLIAASCHVIISNPIQFQVSLYAIHGKSPWESYWGRLKNKVWKALWNEQHIQEHFQRRLRSYNPSVIVNACTGGKAPRGLNSLVQEKLDCWPLYQTNHPSTWKDCDCVRTEKIR